MGKAALKNTRISELVDQNYVHAYVLFYFGIRFYEFSELTLDEVCNKVGIKTDQVVRELESPSHMNEADLPLVTYPVDLIIEYLKHSHFIFIKHKLPYISRLVENFRTTHENYISVERDLKLVFPLFVEDFIAHIYEEEDTLFNYIRSLEKASKGNYNPSTLYYMMEKCSVRKFAMEHECHDDEMEGIRRITKDYHIHPHTPLHVKVIYHELKSFERDLISHARIENEILFPKAMTIENKVREAFFEKSRNN